MRTGAEPAPLPGLSVWARMPRLGKRPARRNAAGPASGSGTPSGRGTRKEDDVSVGTRNGRLNLKPEGDNAPPVSACRKSPPAAAFSAKTRFPCACGAAGETCKETLLRKAQTVEKPLVLERVAFLASFGRSQRSRKMLRHKALGRRKEACALWALGPEGAKATWRRGAKRAAGAASAHRDD